MSASPKLVLLKLSHDAGVAHLLVPQRLYLLVFALVGCYRGGAGTLILDALIYALSVGDFLIEPLRLFGEFSVARHAGLDARLHRGGVHRQGDIERRCVLLTASSPGPEEFAGGGVGGRVRAYCCQSGTSPWLPQFVTAVEGSTSAA